MTSTNNKISNLINSQVPSFVRSDHAKFIQFIEAYYKYLEQTDKAVETAQSLKEQYDIDRSKDIFEEQFNNTFLKLIPKDSIVDKSMLLKNIKDFYRSRGTEKSIRFLMRILYGEEVQEFYYPQKDVLKVSDGKWFVERSLKISDVSINGVANSDTSLLQNFVGTQISGNTSNALAIVERVDIYYDAGVLVKELKISNEYRSFVSGENIFSLFTDPNDGVQKSISANLFQSGIESVTLTSPGTGYSVGDSITIESNTGSGGVIIVSSVSAGAINFISAINGGAGFQSNTSLLITGGGGTGGNAIISAVNTNEQYHPNSYNIVSSTISLEANTTIGNTVYSNLSSSNANTTIANAVSYFVYANTGPIQTVLLISSGNNYTSAPTVTAQANTIVRSLGILGRMEIANGGSGYVIGDPIEIINVPGGYGQGAAANVTNVSGSGAITKVNFVQIPGHITGGSGYDQFYLPTANVVSGTGNGASILVTALLGRGESLVPSMTLAGSILNLSTISRGFGYETAPTLNLKSIGDGTATAVATVIAGAFSYPGRYLNDDGHVSGYNFIEDRDYYQKYSYVIKMSQSINDYRKAINDLIHPTGMKLFGEYITVDNGETLNVGDYEVVTTYIQSPIPTLDLDFTTGVLDSNVTFSRTSSATYVGSDGLIKTASANTPRFEYSSTNRQPKGLLIEGASTNIFKYSENMTNVTWSRTVSITANAAIGPFGTNTAHRLIDGPNFNQQLAWQTLAGVNIGDYFTVSAFAKAGERTQFGLTAYGEGYSAFDLSNGTVIQTGGNVCRIVPYRDGWYRCIATIRKTNTFGDFYVLIWNNTNAYQGEPSKGLYVAHPQLETGNVATSYIPTAASAVTRSLDAASITGTNFSNFYNQSEGTVSVTYSTNNVTGVVLTADNGSYVQRSVQINLFAALNQAATYTVANNVITSTIILSTTQALEYTVGYAYKANNFAGVMNGGIVGVDNSGVMASNVIAMRLGSFFDNNGKLNGTIKYLKYYNKRLANTILQQITTKP